MSSPWNDRLRSSLSASTTTSSAPKRRRRRNKKEAEGPSLADHVKVWVEKKVASGDPEKECSLPFLTNDPKMLNCRLCAKSICLGEEMQCSVLHCEENFHQTCAKEVVGSSVAKPFKCPQHTCYNCKKKGCWRCVRCTIAAHTKCTPWPDGITFTNRPGQAVCWRHPSNWLLDKEHAGQTSDIEEGFHRLPLPYIEEDFQIDSILNDVRENQTEPAPYVPIRRNVYLIKKIRDSVDAGVGCDCSTKSMCKGNCECRSLSVCCSKTCRCLDRCTNKAFRKEKKIEVVKTEYCGWGAVASEALEKGDFVIEYVGEVIDDATCTQRLQDMKHRGDQNIYMCKLNKDFIIDSTYKGNASRFFNHGCNPNCKLEKWRVNGETRLGIFASRSIEVGEPLTYDYRLLLFGPMIKCYCGAPNCRGYIGAKKKAAQVASFKIYRRKESSKAFKIYQRKASSKLCHHQINNST